MKEGAKAGAEGEGRAQAGIIEREHICAEGGRCRNPLRARRDRCSLRVRYFPGKVGIGNHAPAANFGERDIYASSQKKEARREKHWDSIPGQA